ncbi:DUF6232 family protein [Gluconobacter wancherniae]|uniref:DUF6232 family protein n=1 Tax=Gluconobacter wancherniae TaxID=1307955 RepID=UPI001B8C7450|nr:DUF6232 family protein [Gluconobacter wancherniae]MBS1093847.1 hypothetical protein [Gluconobacter wancherniae]
MKQRVFFKRGSISISETVVKFDEIVIPLRQVSFMNITQQPTGLFWMIFIICAISIIGTAMSGYDNGQFYTTPNMEIAFAVAVVIGVVSLFFALKPKQYLSVKSSSGHGHTIWSREYGDLSSIKNGIEEALLGIYADHNE